MECKEKEAFVQHLSELLKQGDNDIQGLHLSEDEDYVAVIFKNGYRKNVCVAGNSYLSIVADVTRVCMN